MDPNRASSVYSDDSSRKPTYLDYRSSIDTSSRPGSVNAARDYVESLGSAPSRPAPMAPSTTSLSSRTSSRPSYMNYQSGSPISGTPVEVSHARTSSRTTMIDTQAVAPYRHSSTLMVFIVAEVHPLTLEYIRVWLKKCSFTAISVVGSLEFEAQIKQLKMEIYGLIGKLGREAAVHTRLQKEWSGAELVRTLDAADVNGSQDVRGVLCCTSYGTNTSTEIMRVGEEDFALSWQLSVGRLHAITTGLLPRLLEGPSGKVMFLVLEPTEQSVTCAIHKAACDALLDQLRSEHASTFSEPVTIDYVDRILLPEPEPANLDSRLDVHHNGYHADDSDFAASESPTKLWAMWQNEVRGS